MKSRGQVAASVAREKAAHPERFCPKDRCLWRTGGSRCQRHQPLAPEAHAALVIAIRDGQSSRTLEVK